MREEKANFALAIASNVNKPILAYFEARLQELQLQLVTASGSCMPVLQGRAQEVMDTIKTIKSVRE